MVKNIVKFESENCKMTSENCDDSIASLMEGLPVRVNNISSAECLEKPSFSMNESQNKKGIKSHIPRSSLAISNSCNDALKNDLNRSKGRPSLIPKSKSIKRTEKANVKIELSVQSEEISAVGKSNKKQVTNKTEIEPDAPKETVTQKQDTPSDELKVESEPSSTNMTGTDFKKEPKDDMREISNTSMQSSTLMTDLKDEKLKIPGHSVTSLKSQPSEYGDAEEDLNNSRTFSDEFLEGENVNEEKEAKRQERGVKTLYETLKATGPMFDNFKWIYAKNQRDNTPSEDEQNFSVQQYYDITLEEISDIWKNTMSLISSVKDHAIKFIEKEQEVNSLDREQLILEGEMVQLAVDFAINYSKLKTDFLIKSVKERLGVDNITKTNLEVFMDSKTFTALYNDDDLATMSRTIKDLNTSVQKEEEVD